MTDLPSTLNLPSYKEQSSDVKKRLDHIKSQPVVIEVDKLVKDFPTEEGMRRILDQVSFKVHKREFLSIIGPSGCGKSTVIRMMACLEDITDGLILVDSYPVTEPGADRGMVFQKYTLFPWLTVKKNVMFGLEVGGASKFDAERDALQWLDIVGLEPYADLYPAQLSGGMQQRVAIARALANKPKVLLMDEPFGALDAQTRAKMQAYLLQIWKKIDITIIFITHDLDEAVYLSDRVLVLEANPGRVQEMVEVPVSRPRSPSQFLSPEFLTTKIHLEELIHPSPEEAQDDFEVVKMVAKEAG
ncbi:ABC transporter ATP-binding protein [Pontiella agarivorans]|uniref:ABC transporter ATP-binding protein n=1 Tax=Pontiella agarivorans TaxID=3038953 RepID=A0ABU5MXY8_9BACT|nr:ABC transporter ATP-binding protein [Pontiella agarivorans]MDZ8118951.1 ABC transporter ATP-binding protein [Pontiella agarivorans]